MADVRGVIDDAAKHLAIIDDPVLADIASTELGNHVLTHWTDNGEPNA